jgi:hypothetical protein
VSLRGPTPIHLVVPLLVSAGCAAGPASGPPLEDPVGVALDARQRGPSVPHYVELTWAYADERGSVDGEAVLRFNPPDSLRLDLFGAGEASMAVSLTESGLRSLGQIEEVRLPAASFMYGTAGLLRPGSEDPSRGIRTDEERILVYPTSGGGERHFALADGRLVRVEEFRADRLVRRLRLEWGDAGPWPRGAEYRDLEAGSRARWEIQETRPREERFEREIFELPERP